MRYFIDLRDIEDKRQLHEKLTAALPLPPWYGRNLDALYDVFTDPSFPGGEDPSNEILFLHTEDAAKRMPAYMRALQQLCLEAASERDDLDIEFED